MRQQNTEAASHGEVKMLEQKKEMVCKLCFSGFQSISILMHPGEVQTHSIKLSLLRRQRDWLNTEWGLFISNQLFSCPKSKEIMFD